MYRRTGLAFSANSMQFLCVKKEDVSPFARFSLKLNWIWASRIRRNENMDRWFRFLISTRATHLILIELAVFVLLFALVLKGDNDETDEDVHHEERDYDDVDDVVGGYYRPKVTNWSVILFIGVDRPVQQSVSRRERWRWLVNSLFYTYLFTLAIFSQWNTRNITRLRRNTDKKRTKRETKYWNGRKKNMRGEGKHKERYRLDFVLCEGQVRINRHSYLIFRRNPEESFPASTTANVLTMANLRKSRPWRESASLWQRYRSENIAVAKACPSQPAYSYYRRHIPNKYPWKKKNVLYPCSAVSSALRTLEACSSRIPRIRLFSLTFAHLRVTFCLLDALSNKFLYYSAICRREFEDLKCSRIRIAILSFVIVRNVYRYNVM